MALSSGKASRNCWTIQQLVGCSVALKWQTLLRLWLITKKKYKTRKVAVGTVKKSNAAITSRWFFRKTNLTLRASPLRLPVAKIISE